MQPWTILLIAFVLVQCSEVATEHQLHTGAVASVNVTTLNSTEDLERLVQAAVLEGNNVTFVINFYAKWCPFSLRLLPRYRALSRAYPGIPHYELDASKHNTLNSKYSIRGFPTVALFQV
jgi:thiol-disulfide isomerase/thioredoxin